MRFTPTAFLFLAACSDTPAPTPTLEWELDNGAATIAARVGTADSFDSGRRARDLLQQAPEAETLEMRFSTEGTDRVGNPIDVPLYILRFDGRDVAASRWRDIDAAHTLNLASDVTIKSRLGRMLLTEKCEFYLSLCSKLYGPPPGGREP
jgi:hypothetical protein